MAYRPMITVGGAPSAPTIPTPRSDPSLAGGFGRALETVADIGLNEIDQRRQQYQTSQLAEARASVQTGVDTFLQGLARDPEFRTYAGRWNQHWTQLEAQTLHGLDPQVQAVLSADLIRLRSDGTRQVASMANQRQDERTLAAITTTIETSVQAASLPGTDHATRRDLIRETYIDAYQAGVIAEDEAVRLTLRDVERYNETAERAAIDRNPVAWLQGHGGLQAPADGQFAPVPAHGGVELPVAAVEAATVAGAAFGAPLRVISGYRSQEHQDRLRAEDPEAAAAGRIAEHSQHTEGTALDIDTSGMSEQEQGRLVASLRAAGFTGFGQYDGHIHADMGPARTWTPLSPSVQAAIAGEITVERPTIASGRSPVPGVPIETSQRLFAYAEGQAADQLAVDQRRVAGRVEAETVAIMSGLTPTFQVTDAEIEAAFQNDPERGYELLDGLNATRRMGTEIASFHNMTGGEIEAFLADQQGALVADETLIEQAARLQVLQEAATRVLEQREADPYSYVMAQSPIVQETTRQAEETQAPEDYAIAINTAMARQVRLGIDNPRPMSQGMVAGFMQSFERADATTRLRLLHGITTDLGDDRVSVAVMSQLEAAGMDPAARLILDANLDGTVAADWLGVLGQSTAIMEEFERRGASPADRTEAVREAELLYDNLRGHVWHDRMNYLGDNGEVLAQMARERDAVVRLAVGLSLLGDPNVQPGGVGGSIASGIRWVFGSSTTSPLTMPDVGDAAGQVIQGLFSHETPVSDDVGLAFVPAERAEAIENGMIAIRAGLAEMDPVQEFGSLLGQTGAQVTREVVEDNWRYLVGEARWVNYGAGYAIAMPTSTGPFGRLLVYDGRVRVWTAEQLAATPPLPEPSLGDIFMEGAAQWMP